MKKDTEYAFPIGQSTLNDGMELRDYFAAKALQGLLSNPKMQAEILKQGQTWVVDSSYGWADEMIEKRKL